eukprot:scaffold14074_cov111-Isochrysis_galbana.AAC.6
MISVPPDGAAVSEPSNPNTASEPCPESAVDSSPPVPSRTPTDACAGTMVSSRRDMPSCAM